MNPDDRIYLAGHGGLVGSAFLRLLRKKGYPNVLLRSRKELDLREGKGVLAFLNDFQPAVVVVAAAKVGGIHANETYPAEFIYDNLAIALNIIDGAYRTGVERVLFLGSSCIYPRDAEQPMREEALLTGPLEKTNEAYAFAKIAGLKLCQHYRRQYGVLYHSAMPTNLYGPGDNYHLENSHVIPALIRKFHEAKINNRPSVTLWGTGSPRREFLHVDDLSRAILHLLEMNDPPDWINVGCGEDVTILELARLIQKIVHYEGAITFDSSKPDGPPRKLLEVSRLGKSGWNPQISLQKGLRQTYRDFLEQLKNGHLRLS